jgi:hypothetical protein
MSRSLLALALALSLTSGAFAAEKVVVLDADANTKSPAPTAKLTATRGVTAKIVRKHKLEAQPGSLAQKSALEKASLEMTKAFLKGVAHGAQAAATATAATKASAGAPASAAE